MYKRHFFLVLITLFVTFAHAQNLIPKKFFRQESELLAQTNPKLDNSGQKCAVILVDVVGVDDLKFAEAIGTPEHNMNEYVVYVSPKSKKLSYKSSKGEGEIDCDDYDVTLESGNTYRLIFDTENHLRQAIFYIKPVEANVTINNQRIKLDETGKGCVDLPIGTYNYTVSASGYTPVSNRFELTAEDLYNTINFELEAITHPLTIICNQEDADLFIDGTPYGKIGAIHDGITLSEAKHSIRLTKNGYEDYEKIIEIDESKKLNITLDKYSDKIIKHKSERTKSTINLRPHTDVIFSSTTYMDEPFKSVFARFGPNFHQYLGILGFNEGFGIGALYASDAKLSKIDKHLAEVKSDVKTNHMAFYMDIPLQLGIALPLSKYNTSQMLILGGAYGSMYYIGHKGENMIGGEAVSTYTFDYGIRANVNFYFNKFLISVEGNKSLKKDNLGLYVGVNIGWRIYNTKD